MKQCEMVAMKIDCSAKRGQRKRIGTHIQARLLDAVKRGEYRKSCKLHCLKEDYANRNGMKIGKGDNHCSFTSKSGGTTPAKRACINGIKRQF
jgi:hypothetical protein